MKLKKATSYALHALMYMNRHITQLPVSIDTVSKAEGIPQSYLSRIFKTLVNADILKQSNSKGKGYSFAVQPGDISLLQLFEIMEGHPLLEDCFMRHCQCQGTPDSCYIYKAWHKSTRNMVKLLGETSLVDATWNHPEHRFNESSTAD